MVEFAVTTKEAALVELHRERKISRHQLGFALELSRFEVEVLLKRHNVTEDLLLVSEFARQQVTLRQAFAE